MSKQAAIDTVVYPFFGFLTSLGFGAFFFEAVGALILGILGAVGGWIAKEFILPYLNNLRKKHIK